MCLKFLIFQFSYKLWLSIYYFIYISKVLNFFHMDDAYILFKSSLTILYFILMVTNKFSFHTSAVYVCLGWSLSRGTRGRASGRWKLAVVSSHQLCALVWSCICQKEELLCLFHTQVPPGPHVCICLCVCVRVREILIIIYIQNILIYIFLFLIIHFNKYILIIFSTVHWDGNTRWCCLVSGHSFQLSKTLYLEFPVPWGLNLSPIIRQKNL